MGVVSRLGGSGPRGAERKARTPTPARPPGRPPCILGGNRRDPRHDASFRPGTEATRTGPARGTLLRVCLERFSGLRVASLTPRGFALCGSDPRLDPR
jgi:hypothetical protein